MGWRRHHLSHYMPWLYSDAVNILTRNGANSYRELSQRLLEKQGGSNFEQSGFLLLPKFDADAGSSMVRQ